MSESLPNNWIKTTVGEVSNLITKGSTPTSYGFSYKEDGIKFIKTENVDQNGNIQNIKTFIDQETNKFLKRSILNKNDILFSIAGTIGRVGIVKENDLPANTNQALAIIRSSWDLIDVKYLFYLLRSNYAQRQARGSIVGVGRANVSLTNSSDFKIPLPPFPEQHRIVAKIEELFTKLDAGVEALKQVQVQLKRYRQSVLKAAMEGKLTAEWREQHKDELEPADKLLKRILKEHREKWEAEQFATYKDQGKTPPKNWQNKYKEPLLPDTTALPELPKIWTWATAEQLTNLVTDGEHITPPRTKNGILLLSARNIQNGYLSFHKVDYVSKETYKRLLKRLRIESGDVLMSCSGSVGRSCIAPKSPIFCLVRSVAVLKPVFIMGDFLSYCIRSPFLQKQIDEKKTQTAQANIFQGKIKQLIFPLAPSLEQKKIVENIDRLFSIVDESELIIDSELKRAQSLRQSILKRAFEGQLVPQNSNDEPASVLLERIKTEKAKSKKSKQMEMF